MQWTKNYITKCVVQIYLTRFLYKSSTTYCALALTRLRKFTQNANALQASGVAWGRQQQFYGGFLGLLAQRPRDQQDRSYLTPPPMDNCCTEQGLWWSYQYYANVHVDWTAIFRKRKNMWCKLFELLDNYCHPGIKFQLNS